MIKLQQDKVQLVFIKKKYKGYKLVKKNKKYQGGGKKNIGEVHIIAGDLKGRKLAVLDAEGLRPTSSRVRETVFNWLQFDIVGANCLDVFAGSGALGFEALSRGASSVTMLELDVQNYRMLKSNKLLLNVNNLTINNLNALDFLIQPSGCVFNIIFIDPPFYQDLMQQTINLLFKNNNLLDKNTILYLEQEKSLELPEFPDGWLCYREKITSQVRYGLFVFK